MRLSKLNIKKINLKDIDNTYPAQSILTKIGELYQYESGIFGFGNILVKLQQNIENIIKDELDKADCIECNFATMQPRSIWEKSGRWDRYVDVDKMMFTVKTDKNEYGLAPTAEEACTIFASNRLLSVKNLPAVYYQLNDKYRNELRPRGYLFRPRVFSMMDAYSFDKDEKDMENTYNKMHDVYLKIFDRLGLKIVSVTSDNGTMGGKVSEEWMALTEFGEDTVLYDEERGCGYNLEVLEGKSSEDLLEEYGITDIGKLKSYKALEMGNNFQLGNKYSESMGLYFNNNNVDSTYYMGCYGIGVSRIMAVILEDSVIKDEDNNVLGISLPLNLAPYKAQIIYKDTKKDEAEALYRELLDNNINVIIDDREKLNIGAKIKDTLVIGTPYTIVIGDKGDDNLYEVEDTKTNNKEYLSTSDIMELLKENY